MIKDHQSSRLALAAGFACMAFLLGGCSGGGGSSSSGGSSEALTLQDISVSSGQTWQINRRIGFTFSQPVDFGTVNMNTINVAQVNGAPAIGSFEQDPADPRRIFFVPTCPTKADFSDAGLLPGGVQYRILVPGADSSALTIQSMGGKKLDAGQTLVFNTPTSTVLTQLFLDPVNGPPTPVLLGSGATIGTRVVLGGDTSSPIHFELNQQGIGELEGAALLPLNLYSRPQSRVEVYVEFNQPVNPSTENLSSTRLRLQYDSDPAPGSQTWTPVAARVELVANCTATGATVRITPIGVLPQDRDLRVFVSAEFEDLVGDRNILPLTDFARMTTDYFQDGLGFPLEFTDEYREEFMLSGNQVGSVEDTDAVFDGPSANWSGGELSAAFGFSGTGGPGGNFDWHIPANTDFILSTTATLITGGPGGVPVTQQLVIGGRLDVRNLSIPASSTLRIQGPNPAVILCSGNVDLRGKIVVNGVPAVSVFTVGTPTLPEAGGTGHAGGGRGGTASFITTGPTPRGGSGFGAFNVEGLGGEGGESGYLAAGASFARKAGAGGGGVFGHDQILPGVCASNAAVPFRDQTLVGLDAEDGFPGAMTASSAIRNEPMPWGGHFGAKPFFNPNDTPAEREDDFFGIKVKGFNTAQPTLMVGELPTPWAGAGGGAGGDSINSNTYPPPSFIFNQHQKGCGGGGGAGSLHIQALGSIVFASTGRIEARGGSGGRGESFTWQAAIGGGSGGGSGGHIILETASTLDLSQLAPNTLAIVARGGQGGAAATGTTPAFMDLGGASETGETTPLLDAIHNGGPTDNPFSVNGCPTSQPFYTGAGGDGGPGIVQIHVSNIVTDILYPAGGANTLGNLCKPAPLGYNWTGTTGQWVDHYLPQFGSVSRAQSKWIPLGQLTVAPDPITFSFEGTNPANGQVIAVGETVQSLPAILAPVADISDVGLPSIDPQDPATLILSATDLAPADEVYRENPNLMVRFELLITPQGGGDPVSFDVQSASYTASADEFAVTVNADLPSAGTVELRPRYFLIETNGVESVLPTTAGVQIQFQAAPASVAGQPDDSNIFPGTGQWANDISTLSGAPGNTNFRFFRFRVSFDIGNDLSFNTPRPGVDFLRVPFRF